MQAGAIFITFAFLTVQTINTNNSLDQTRKAMTSTAASNVGEFMKEVNLVVLQDDDLRELFNYKKSDLLAFIFINKFNEWYTYHENGLISNKEWKNTQDIIRMISKIDWVNQKLLSYYSIYDQLHADYRNFLID